MNLIESFSSHNNYCFLNWKNVTMFVFVKTATFNLLNPKLVMILADLNSREHYFFKLYLVEFQADANSCCIIYHYLIMYHASW